LKEGLLLVNKKKQGNFLLWFRVRTGSGAPWIESFFGSFCSQKEQPSWSFLHA